MKEISLRAYAKINLALDVVKKREDGYHDVKMIMQNIGLYDDLVFIADTGYAGRKITINCDKDGVPTDNRNLIYKAVNLMFDEYNLSGSIEIDLKKNIPVEAGLAGGSTDCAATLKAVNQLYNLGADTVKLMALGGRLGADVPYCVLEKTSLAEGIGDILTPVQGLADCYILLAKPPEGVSTKLVYTNLKVNEIVNHPEVDKMIQALFDNSLEAVAGYMGNVLENVTLRLNGKIQVIKDIMKENGALNAIMSGSGPTVFGIFRNKETASRAGEIIRKMGLSGEVFVTAPVNL